MIEYNEYGDAEGCTHNLGPHDMDMDEAWMARRAIHHATDSLTNWAESLHREVAQRQADLTDAQTDLASALQRVRILEGFANWVLESVHAGTVVTEVHRRAQRALLGQERHESQPPRPM